MGNWCSSVFFCYSFLASEPGSAFARVGFYQPNPLTIANGYAKLLFYFLGRKIMKNTLAPPPQNTHRHTFRLKRIAAAADERRKKEMRRPWNGLLETSEK